MIDEHLFIRGHIDVRIEDRPIDDYDVIIPDHYFEGILGCTGEVIDSNGSEYQLKELTADDYFDIIFTVHDTEYETINGTIVAFEELVVQCTGHVIQVNGCDTLDITTYDVISRT